ncbi:MAG: O-antigen ligase family protein [Blastochloris sp.]|nr:O-antigen ligase family protein [Blastochloris sp.]
MFLPLHNGQAKEISELRLKPAKIFLGTLSYGLSAPNEIKERNYEVELHSNQTGWKITQVDLSQAEGVSVRLEQSSPQSWKLLIRVEDKLLVQGYPYGSLIKKWVRIETDLPDQAQALITLTGLLTDNQTKRDFGQFVFLGQARWQGKWSTPNIAGSILSVLLIAVTGLLASAISQGWKRRTHIIMGATLLPCIMVGLWLLAATYSRGAWVAFGVGWVILWFLLPAARNSGPLIRPFPLRFLHGAHGLLLLVLFLFIGFLSLLPKAMERAGSSVAVAEDKSISHRLLVWKGAWQMMGEKPWTGVGRDRFGPEFSLRYQEQGHRAEYSTAINDFLTWGAERGIPALALILGVPMALLGLNIFNARRFAPVSWTAWISASLGCLICASCFSTLSFVREWQILYFLLTACLLAQAILQSMKGPHWRTQFRAFCFWIAGTVLLLGLALGGISQASLAAQPVIMQDQTLDSGNRLWTLQPRHQTALGTLLYFQDERESASQLMRTTLRPLAARGWRVIALEKMSETTGDPDQLLQILPPPSGHSLPLLLAGHGGGAASALKTWESLSENPSERPVWLALYGWEPKPGWLDGLEESVQNRIRVLHSLFDDKASPNHWIYWQRSGRLDNKGVSLHLSPHPVSRETLAWQEWLDLLTLPKTPAEPSFP